MAAEPGVVPAPPGQPLQPSAQFGILPANVSKIADNWRTQGNTVGALDFSANTAAKGEGSATFAAMRTVADPATAATDSIAKRLTTLADGLRAFNSRAVETDDTAADGFRAIPER
ncbi:MAG: hypothetical protein WBG39_15795 [Gordonia sp. (in: high G+C Gram-positive bacteria)]